MKKCPNQECGTFYSEVLGKFWKEYHYCPFCGTKLDEEEDA